MSGSADDPTAPWTRLLWAALVAIGLFVVALTLFAASAGPRGSDQYWYLADVETLVRDHLVATNTVFPVGILGPDPVVPPPFIHNILSLYLAAVPALVLGPFRGWLALDVVATLATAVLIFLAARTVANRWAALLCAVLYPLLPITLWQTAQPLAEASIAFFVALAVYLLAVARTSAVRWLGVLIAVGLLYMSRQSYLPLLLAVPVGFLIVRAREHPAGVRGAIGPTVALVVGALVIVAAGQVLFGAQDVQVSYARLLHTDVPGQTDNMWFNFDLSPANLADRLPFDIGLLGPKLVSHLAEQFVSFDSAPVGVFFWTFNVLALVAVACLWRYRHDPKRTRLVLAALALVATHFVTVVLFQNQFRYTLPALPALLVVLAMPLSDAARLERLVAPRPIAALLVLTLIAAGPDLLIARMIRNDGAASAVVEASAGELLDRFVAPADHTMIVYTNTPHILAYAARPRLILYVSSAYTNADFDRLAEAFPAQWILAPTDSVVLTTLAIAPQSEVGDVDAFGVRWGLFRVPE